jgi:hypothetical protein
MFLVTFFDRSVKARFLTMGKRLTAWRACVTESSNGKGHATMTSGMLKELSSIMEIF